MNRFISDPNCQPFCKCPLQSNGHLQPINVDKTNALLLSNKLPSNSAPIRIGNETVYSS